MSSKFHVNKSKIVKIFCFKKLNHKRWVMEKPVIFGEKVMTSGILMCNKGWKLCFRVSLWPRILVLNLVTKVQVEQILGRRMGVESTPSSTYWTLKNPTVLGLRGLLIWSLDDDVGNGLNVANDVNVNVNDVNDVNGARNVINFQT